MTPSSWPRPGLSQQRDTSSTLLIKEAFNNVHFISKSDIRVILRAKAISHIWVSRGRGMRQAAAGFVPDLAIKQEGCSFLHVTLTEEGSCCHFVPGTK